MSSWNKIGSDKMNPNSRSSTSAGAGGGMHREEDPYYPSYSHQGIPGHPVSQLSSGNSSQSRAIPSDKRSRENIHRFAGLAVGLASVVSEHVLSHPCIVLRRQCQVHDTSNWSHLTPFTLFHTVFNIQRNQSTTTLWKGIGSALMVKGIAVASEATIHQFTPLPREVNRHSSLKKMAEHILLKSLSFAIITPFYAASLVETVQSEIACERPGIFDSIIEGFSRLISFTSAAQPTRLLPIWKLILPTVVYGVSQYIIASLAKYRVSVTMRNDLVDTKDLETDHQMEKTIYETYYPELVATFTGNLLADTLLYPLETVLHRLYLQGTRTIIDNTDTGLEVVPIITRYDGLFDCYRTILSQEGLSGLFKGFGALILQYGLHIAILKLTRFIFEMISKTKDVSSSSSSSEASRGVRFEMTTRRPDEQRSHGARGRDDFRGHERSGFN